MSEREREKHTKRGFYEVIRRTPLKIRAKASVK